jgi:hypothetical protein
MAINHAHKIFNNPIIKEEQKCRILSNIAKLCKEADPENYFKYLDQFFSLYTELEERRMVNMNANELILKQLRFDGDPPTD